MIALFSVFTRRVFAIIALPGAIALLSWLFAIEQRDSYVNLFAIAMLISMIARFGADQYLFRLVSADHRLSQNARASGRDSLFLSAVLASVGLVLWWVVRGQGEPDNQALLALSATIAALIVQADRATILQMEGALLRSALAFPGPVLAAGIAFMVMGLAPVAAMAAGGLAVAVIGGLSAARDYFTAPRLAKPALFAQAQTMTPFAMLNINRIAYEWGVSIYLVGLVGPASVTLYLVAGRLAAILSLPANTLNSYYLSAFSRNAGHDGYGASRKLIRDSIMLCLVAQAATITLYVLFYDWISHFFQVDGDQLLTVLLPLCLAQIVHGLSGPLGSMLLMTGHEKKVAATAISIAGLTMVSGYLMTQRFGLTGLGWSMASALIVQNMIYAGFFLQSRRKARIERAA